MLIPKIKWETSCSSGTNLTCLAKIMLNLNYSFTLEALLVPRFIYAEEVLFHCSLKGSHHSVSYWSHTQSCLEHLNKSSVLEANDFIQ